MKEFFNLVTIEEALQKVETGSGAGTGSEKIAVRAALGRVLAADIISKVDVPPFSRSTMDGYAVRAEDTFGASESIPVFLEVMDRIEMGEPAEKEIASGQAAAVATGGMLPPGADAVVMIEETEKLGAGEIEVQTAVGAGENIVKKGEDISRGEKLLTAGSRLRPQDLGALSGIGIVEVEVYSRPEVAVFSTGDEIISPEEEPGPGQIRDINSYSIGGLVERAGGCVQHMGIIPDCKDELRENLRQAAEKMDLVVLSGGSSVGVKDLTIEVLNELGEPGVVVHGVAIKPGKPTIIAIINDTPVLGLPGHPTSAMVVFEIMGRPIIERLSGLKPGHLPAVTRISAQLTRNIASDRGRREYFRVRLKREGERLLAEPMLGKSSLISTMVAADGLVEVARGSEGCRQGTEVEVRIFG